MNIKMNTGVAALVLSGVLTGCMTGPQAIPAVGVKATMDSLPGADSLDFSSNDKTSVFVTSTFQKKKHNAFTEEMITKVGKLVNKSGSESVDRSMASKLQKEIVFASGKSNAKPYTGPKVADYTIIVNVDDLEVSADYISGSKTEKDGKTYVSEPFCSYTATTTGSIEVRKLPSLERAYYSDLKAKGTENLDTYSKICKDKDAVAKAKSDSVDNLLLESTELYKSLMKFVAPKAYVVGAYTVEDKTYFETSLGRSDGAKPGEKVKIYQEMDGELVEVAGGKILNDKNIFMKKSYISVSKDSISAIKKGMIVQKSGECSGLKCVTVMAKKVESATGLGT